MPRSRSLLPRTPERGEQPIRNEVGRVAAGHRLWAHLRFLWNKHKVHCSLNNPSPPFLSPSLAWHIQHWAWHLFTYEWGWVRASVLGLIASWQATDFILLVYWTITKRSHTHTLPLSQQNPLVNNTISHTNTLETILKFPASFFSSLCPSPPWCLFEAAFLRS